VATSTDLVRWEKYPGNPLQPVAENKSSGIVVHDGEKFRLYTMHPAVYLHVPPPAGTRPGVSLHSTPGFIPFPRALE
jgi:hypothetical protein